MNTLSDKLSAEQRAEMKNDVKSFFTKDLLSIIKTIFMEPIKGTYSMFSESNSSRFSQSMILMFTTLIVYCLVSFMAVDRFHFDISFSVFLRIGIVPVVFILFVSLFSFVVKSISGKTNFKNEIFTGALCAIPLLLFIVISIMASILGNDIIDSMIIRPSRFMQSGLFFILIVLYLFLMLVNILQQSLKAAKTKDAVAWYLAPLGILLAFYLTSLVLKNVLF